MAKQYLSKEDIEEIISDTFVVLWKNRNKLDKAKDLSPYIAGITRNLVREKTRVINIHNDISDYENIIQDFFKIDMLCEQREKIAIIDKTVKNMKKIDIEIFELYYLIFRYFLYLVHSKLILYCFLILQIKIFS